MKAAGAHQAAQGNPSIERTRPPPAGPERGQRRRCHRRTPRGRRGCAGTHGSGVSASLPPRDPFVVPEFWEEIPHLAVPDTAGKLGLGRRSEGQTELGLQLARIVPSRLGGRGDRGASPHSASLVALRPTSPWKGLESAHGIGPCLWLWDPARTF